MYDLGWSSLCGQGCPRAHGNPPASALQVLILCEPFSLTSAVNFKEVNLLLFFCSVNSAKFLLYHLSACLLQLCGSKSM